MTEKNTVKTENNIEVYETEIEYYLDLFLTENNIDNLDSEPQSKWNCILRYIYKNVFKNTDKLKTKPYDVKTNTGTISNNNKYDLDKVNDILDLYIDLCFKYGKEVSIVGFSYLTGIEQETFYKWFSENTNKQGVEIYKKLNRTREESLSDKLYSSKNNPVGVLGILNHWYGWNMGQPHGSTESKPKSIEQIQQNYIEQKDTDTTKGEKTGDNRE